MKKLIPAIVMLLVSAVVLSTASYAWFTISATATAQGMSVTATAPSSILISGQLKDGNMSNPSHTVVFDQDSAPLAPVSSKDGLKFYEPVAADDVLGGVQYGTTFNPVSDPVADKQAVQYIIELTNDASSVEETSGDTTVEKGEIIGIGVDNLIATSTLAINDAIRIAFTTDLGTFVYVLDNTTQEWVRIPIADGKYDGDDADTEPDSKAVGPISEATYNAEFAVAAKGEAATFATEATCITVLKPQETARVTVTVWYEGQDDACVGSNGGKTSGFSFEFIKVTIPDTITEDKY